MVGKCSPPLVSQGPPSGGIAIISAANAAVPQETETKPLGVESCVRGDFTGAALQRKC